MNCYKEKRSRSLAVARAASSCTTVTSPHHFKSGSHINLPFSEFKLNLQNQLHVMDETQMLDDPMSDDLASDVCLLPDPHIIC